MSEKNSKDENQTTAVGPFHFFRQLVGAGQSSSSSSSRIVSNGSGSPSRPVAVPGVIMPVMSDSSPNYNAPPSPLSTSSSNTSSSFSTSSTASSQRPYRIAQFEGMLNADNADMMELRKASWNGVPIRYRTQVWQLLLGYMPTNKSRRDTAISRKRKEYVDVIPIYFNEQTSDRTTQEGELLRQILVDLPRTSPDTPFFQQVPIQKAMERILYIWSIRHPASGYVQGMNDILTPLLIISMYPYFNDVLRCDVQQIDPKTLMDVEADSYWCLTKLLDNIQDHYTSSQPGLQRMLLRFEDLMNRIDSKLNNHLKNEGLHYLQFSFRWMNCLLVREMPLKAIMRVWDTYLAEETSGFENFHVYVCAVLLQQYKEKLLTMQFQDILIFLQDLPITEWDESDVEPLLSQAYVFSTLFDNAPNHLA